MITYEKFQSGNKYNVRFVENGVVTRIEFYSVDGSDRHDIMKLVGESLIEEIVDAFDASGLTVTVKSSIFITITPVMTALLMGRPRESRAVANNTATTSDFTQSRKNALLAIIDNRLAAL